MLSIVAQSTGLRTTQYLPMLKFKGLYERANNKLTYDKTLSEREIESLEIERASY